MEKGLNGMERVQEDLHSALDTRMEDVEKAQQVDVMDINVIKIQLSSVERDVCLLDSLMENAHQQLEGLSGRVDRFIQQNHHILALSSSGHHSISLWITKIEEEFHPQIQGWWGKFERMNDVVDKKFTQMDTELEKVVELTGQKIDAKMGEISSDFLEVMEIEEAHQVEMDEKVISLEGKIASLQEKLKGTQERLEHALTNTANLVTLLLLVQHCIADVEDAVMDTNLDEGEGNTVVSSSSSELDPVENMVVIPVPAPAVVQTLVEIPEEYVPPSL
jgi:hypothetical protein